MIERIVMEVKLDEWDEPMPLGAAQIMIQCKEKKVWVAVEVHGTTYMWSFPGCRLGDFVPEARGK